MQRVENIYWTQDKEIKGNGTGLILQLEDGTMWKPISVQDMMYLEYEIKESIISSIYEVIEQQDQEPKIYYGVNYEDPLGFWGKVNPKYLYTTKKEATEAYNAILEAQKQFKKFEIDKQFVIKNLSGRYFID